MSFSNTTALFNNMLKRYMPYELLVESMKKKNYFWNKVNKKQGWTGGSMEVPFEGGEFSGLQFGGLSALTDVGQATYVMGIVTQQPELWGTMLFNEKDLDRTGDLEKNYLEIVPGKIDQFVSRMSERVSMSLLADGAIAYLTANGSVGAASITVDRPENFTIGEKVMVVDNDTAAGAVVYVTGINMATKVVTIQDRQIGIASPTTVDLSAYTTAQNARVVLPGADDSGFTSLASQLLSNANGGSTQLFGQTKTAYPFLQAANFDATAWNPTTGASTLSNLTDCVFTTAQIGKSNTSEIVGSFGLFKNIAKSLEGNRRFTATDSKSGYGWRSIEILGPEGAFTLTGLRDMPNKYAYLLDWDGITFHGDEFFERKRHLDGNEFYLTRTAGKGNAGYQYVLDIKFYGDLVVSRPSSQGIITNLPSIVTA
jgi:hypothetical protein